MFERLLRFFLENYKINYTLFFLLFALGIYSYTQIPKEISPIIEPNSISIRGSYSGASVETLNNMAVSEIENEVRNITGVAGVTSIISPGRFSIILELEDNADKEQVKTAVEDALALVQNNLPTDMQRPTIRTVAHSRSIMHLSIRSDSVSRAELKRLAKKLRTKINSLKDISDVTIFGDSDLFYEVLIDEKKLKAYGLQLEDVVRIFSELSYIYPLGKIDNDKGRYFISTHTAPLAAQKLEKTAININSRQLELGNIATITKRYEDSSTLASMNAKNSITLAVSQNPQGDAIEIAKRIRDLLKGYSVEGVIYDIKMDKSTLIKDRLGVVISNILLGIILITVLTMLLINKRIAMVIALGIPTSFIMGAIYFYFTGHSININSLIGVLIAIGIIVDDAIVVSESIQQYIEKGFSPKEAALLGTKEVAKPVTIASLTTVFSFIPLLMLSGRIGQIIELIPIAFSALIVASLLESFIFLPIHAAHLLRTDAKTRSWERAKELYKSILQRLIAHKRLFLGLFFVIVPITSFYAVEHARFQLFRSFDGSTLNITLKAVPTTTLEESLHIVQTIERDLLAHKEKFFVKAVSSTAGYRRSATGSAEMYPYVGHITLELYKRAPQNFVERYITPLLNFYYDPHERIRTKSSKQIARELREFLREKRYKKRFRLTNLIVVESGIGHVKADIRIGVISSDYKKAMKAIDTIENAMAKLHGIKYFGDNVKTGTEEIKITLNSFAQQLGITQKYIGSYIANLYLNKKVGTIFDGNELLDVKVRSANYKGDLESFKNLEIPLKDGDTSVKLKEIADFTKVQTLERLVKDNGQTTFFVFANVDASVLTATEALQKLAPTLKRVQDEYGVDFKFKGEREQKRVMQHDMLLASLLAIVLIFIAILYLFNSFKQTLIVMSVIPLSLLGVYAGHYIMGMNISLPSLIGALGLAGVIVNDGIIMMDTIKNAHTDEEIFTLATKRLRPIIITSLTTIVGLASLIFFPTGEAVTFQPIAVSMGFGLLWGTFLNLLYLPVLYSLLRNHVKR